MATFSNVPRPGYIYDSTDGVWYPIGTGAHSHGEIPVTTIDAKGDLLVGTGADAVARKAVGADGSYLVADSTQTTGVNWAGPSNTAGKNAVINGGFDVWQRGATISLAASTAYTSGFSADRWQSSTAANQATTITRQYTNDPTNLPHMLYCLRFQRNSGQTGTTGYSLVQNFESINAISFAGKTATLSFYARAGANYSAASSALSAIVYAGTGTDQNAFVGYTGSSTPINQSVTLTTTWQRFSITAAFPSSTNEIAPVFVFTPSGTAGTNDYFEITGVQLELGSTATPFSRAGGTIQGELAACQRYLPAVIGIFSLNSFSQNTTRSHVSVAMPVTSRVAPTGITIPALSNFTLYNSAFSSGTPTGINFDTGSTAFCNLTIDATAGSPTQVSGQGTQIRGGASAYILFTGCEL